MNQVERDLYQALILSATFANRLRSLRLKALKTLAAKDAKKRPKDRRGKTWFLHPLETRKGWGQPLALPISVTYRKNLPLFAQHALESRTESKEDAPDNRPSANGTLAAT